MDITMIIKKEEEYKEYCSKLDAIIARGTALGDMELLDSTDKQSFMQLSDAISQYEAAYHPLPNKVSTVITDAIKEKMEEKKLNQKQTATILGISASRVNELLHGKRSLNINLLKRLRDSFGIPADFVLDNM